MEEIFKLKMKEALRKIEEGCVGGVCSVGGGSTNKGSSAGNKTVASAGSAGSRISPWSDGEEGTKEGVLPQAPDTQYVEQEDGKPFTGEEVRTDDWTSKELKFESEVRADTDGMGHQLSDLKERYNQMMEAMMATEPEMEPEYDQLAAPVTGQEAPAEIDPAHQTAQDLGAVSTEQSLAAVTDHFATEGTPIEIMVVVNGTSKSVQEWENEISRDSEENLQPEVPQLDATEGGDDGQDEEEVGNPVSFPEIEPNEV